MDSDSEPIVGVDFAGPRGANDQRRKIIAIAAHRVGVLHYVVDSEGFNSRLITARLPGWTAAELAAELSEATLARVIAFDFPFSIPHALLMSSEFAAAVGQNALFESWLAFNQFVDDNLPLNSPISFDQFAGWRDKRNWQKRATDRLCSAQPPLKDRFQVLFNMTLVGNAVLAQLRRTRRYRIVPFDTFQSYGEVIEVYPGVAMRDLGRSDYKRNPAGALLAIRDRCQLRGIRVDIDVRVERFCQLYSGANGGRFDSDGSDALITLLTAILYREGDAAEVLDGESFVYRATEGVIWKPIKY